MKSHHKSMLCWILTIITAGVVFCFPPMAQDPAYHQFADGNAMYGIPNFWNVVSNLPFVLIALFGFWKLRHLERFYLLIGYTVCLGIFLTGFGSAWYHLSPGNESLVWDRLPMTIVFMSFVTFIIYDRVNQKLGSWLFLSLMALGIFSVWYWNYTENMGRGDLRLYGFIQFYPMILIPLLVFLYQRGKPIMNQLIWILVFYVGAKLCEHYDHQIFTTLGFMSGHAIKHLLSAGATWFIVKTQTV